MTTATLAFSDLFTPDPSATPDRAPLEELGSSGNQLHVHGRLTLTIAGRVVPAMGFLGADDVCLNTWVKELVALRWQLASRPDASYTFDEGEQGQPAFEFRRCEDALAVSVVASEISGAEGDESFQHVACRWSDFQQAVHDFLVALRETLRERCPAAAESWWMANANAPSGQGWRR